MGSVPGAKIPQDGEGTVVAQQVTSVPVISLKTHPLEFAGSQVSRMLWAGGT